MKKLLVVLDLKIKMQKLRSVLRISKKKANKQTKQKQNFEKKINCRKKNRSKVFAKCKSVRSKVPSAYKEKKHYKLLFY